MSETVDPVFVAALRTNISGIYYRQVANLPADKIAEEFRKVMRNPELFVDEEFMTNLLFLVRKRDLRELRLELEPLVSGRRFTPQVEVSALKTLFAIGSASDRAAIDARMSALLKPSLANPENLGPSPYLDAADRIGAEKTLEVLERAKVDASERQRRAEQTTPEDHARIEALDRFRSALEEKAFTLSSKQRVLAQAEQDRTGELVSLYLRRPRHLGAWAFKELVEHRSSATIDAVRTFLATRLDVLPPLRGSGPPAADPRLDYRLRGIWLLEAMGAELTEPERRLLQEHEERIKAQPEYFQPKVDWEDVLDRV